MSERYADGAASLRELVTANYWAEAPTWDYDQDQPRRSAAHLAFFCSTTELLPRGLERWTACVFRHMTHVPWPGTWLVRDLFGYLFRPGIVSLWQPSGQAVALAREIYADRRFDRLPALADALQKAGCKDESLLEHCRRPGTHVRGCWAVDRVLGLEQHPGPSHPA